MGFWWVDFFQWKIPRWTLEASKIKGPAKHVVAQSKSLKVWHIFFPNKKNCRQPSSLTKKTSLKKGPSILERVSKNTHSKAGKTNILRIEERFTCFYHHVLNPSFSFINANVSPTISCIFLMFLTTETDTNHENLTIQFWGSGKCPAATPKPSRVFSLKKHKQSPHSNQQPTTPYHLQKNWLDNHRSWGDLITTRQTPKTLPSFLGPNNSAVF